MNQEAYNNMAKNCLMWDFDKHIIYILENENDDWLRRQIKNLYFYLKGKHGKRA